MKIHCLNSTGTLGVVIPMDITKSLGWKDGQDVIFYTTEDDSKLILRNMTLKGQQDE